MEQSGAAIDDDSPGTPTNASNSLSLSEGREYFDDEIADQPGLVFDDNSRAGAETQSAMASQVVTENSHTLVESSPKTGKYLLMFCVYVEVRIMLTNSYYYTLLLFKARGMEKTRPTALTMVNE